MNLLPTVISIVQLLLEHGHSGDVIKPQVIGSSGTSARE